MKRFNEKFQISNTLDWFQQFVLQNKTKISSCGFKRNRQQFFETPPHTHTFTYSEASRFLRTKFIRSLIYLFALCDWCMPSYSAIIFHRSYSSHQANCLWIEIVYIFRKLFVIYDEQQQQQKCTKKDDEEEEEVVNSLTF